MTKKNCREINLVWGKVCRSKSAVHERMMPTIKCLCGMRILVVPDLKAMNRAIKNHIAEHKRADYGLETDSYKRFLTEQILFVTSEMNLPNVS